MRPATHTRYMRVALLAFLAMLVQDMLATCMVVFEAHYEGYVAGAFDAAYWIAGLMSTGQAIMVISKEGWRSHKALTIIGAITAANYIGTVVGVTIAKGLT